MVGVHFGEWELRGQFGKGGLTSVVVDDVRDSKLNSASEDEGFGKAVDDFPHLGLC